MRNRKNILIYTIITIIIIFIPSILLISKINEQNLRNKPKSFKFPKNIIFMISDGMGFNTMTATDFYQNGDTNLQKYQSFPVKYAMCTYPLLSGSYPDNLKWNNGYSPQEMWTNFNYALSNYTESGAASTAMATGIKTYNNAIGKDVNHNDLINLTQIAKMIKKSAGVVTSVQWSHATPAGFVAHNLTRKNYSEIAYEMLLETKLDVIMGCGNPDFDNNGLPANNSHKYVGDSFIWSSLKNGDSIFYLAGGKADTVEDCNDDGIRDPWTLIQDRSEFQNLINGNTPQRVLGVPKVFETLQQMRSGDSNANPYEIPFISTVPTLVEMSLSALNILDNNPNGFFLMIEGGAIDWAAHSNQKGRLIEEQIEFNKTVDAVIKWIENNSSWEETLLIVTSDHECGYLWGPGSGVPNKYNPIINNGKSTLPDMKFYSDEHTNSLVPFFSKGIGSEIFHVFADESDPIRGKYIQNSEIAQGIILLLDRSLNLKFNNFYGVNLFEEPSVICKPNNFINKTNNFSILSKKDISESQKYLKLLLKLSTLLK
ncbi:MAG: alkaline phosphatase [Ignavibacteria bacterium]|nr:alkaline phosphatase [Ignavibacteria bacterium]